MVSPANSINCEDQTFIYVWGALDISFAIIAAIVSTALKSSSTVAASAQIIQGVVSLSGVRSTTASDAIQKRNATRTQTRNRIFIYVIAFTHISYYVSIFVMMIAQNILQISNDTVNSQLQMAGICLHTLQVAHHTLRSLQKNNLSTKIPTITPITALATRPIPSNPSMNSVSEEIAEVSAEANINLLSEFNEDLLSLLSKDTWSNRLDKMQKSTLGQTALLTQIVVLSAMMMRTYYIECN